MGFRSRRRVDDLGRIVIPKEIRSALLAKEGDPLEIFINEDSIIFKKVDGNKIRKRFRI
jgi:transcriptional pleiotropic regulator of transition state genes